MRRILIVPVIAGILLTMSACGAKEETSTAAPSAKSSESDQSTTTKVTTTEGDETDATDDVPSDGALGDLPIGLDKGCIQVSALMMQSIVLVNPDASTEDYDKLESDIAEAKADMPDEIADAFDTWSDAWTEFASAMEDINTDGGFANPANVSKIEAASKSLDNPEVEAASTEIEKYIDEKCDAGS